MKFRGLHSAVVERDAQGRVARREMIVFSVFALGVVTDARPVWALMAYAHSGSAKSPASPFARSEARRALLAAAN